MKMTPVNGSVKMSPHEKGDSFIEPEGAAALDGIEPGRGRRPHGEGGCGVGWTISRQLRRLLAGYRKEGVTALAHGNRGRRPVHAVSEDTRKCVIALAQDRYAGFNHHHLTELLAEREGLVLSRPSVWRILSSAGLRSPRRRRPPRHRCRRERYPKEGMLLLVDGSRHDWLECRAPYLTLIGAVDDATGTVPYALFRDQEDTQGYLLLLREIISRKGIPLALYTDRHGIFQRSPREPETLEEQLSGEREPTQFGRALRELGIRNIFALSPQARGRSERLWGTFQDRLVAELRLARAGTLEEANQVLWDFLPRYNARFGVIATQEGTAYRQMEPTLCLDGVLCFKYRRTVARDNTVRLNGYILQLLPGVDRLSYDQARVEVQERLDGSLVVQYQGKTIASREAPPNPVTLRARSGARGGSTRPSPGLAVGMSHNATEAHPCREKTRPQAGRRPTYKPGPNHPWRKPLLVTKSQN